MKRKIAWVIIMIAFWTLPNTVQAKLVKGNYIDIHSHWAEQEIQEISNLGIMTGIKTTSQGFKVFAPEAKVTRAQLATTLVRAFHLDYGTIRFIKQPVASDYFIDVPDQSWYADAVTVCAINNIFAITNERKFYPEQPVTRLETAVAIYDAFSIKGITSPGNCISPSYRDTGGLPLKAINAMNFVSSHGIMQGNGGYFNPQTGITRAEMAAVLHRSYNVWQKYDKNLRQLNQQRS